MVSIPGVSGLPFHLLLLRLTNKLRYLAGNTMEHTWLTMQLLLMCSTFVLTVNGTFKVRMNIARQQMPASHHYAS